MISNNVVIFPKQNKNSSQAKSFDEIKQNMEMMRHYHIQETIANIIPVVFNQLEIAGFHMDDQEESDIKDGAFIVESLRSIMCKYYDIYHPFQQIAENVFSQDKEEGTLRIADSINISLNNDQKEKDNV